MSFGVKLRCVVGLFLCLAICGCDEVIREIDFSDNPLDTNPAKCYNILAGAYELVRKERIPPFPGGIGGIIAQPKLRGDLVITPHHGIFMRIFQDGRRIDSIEDSNATFELFPSGMCSEGSMMIIGGEKDGVFFAYELENDVLTLIEYERRRVASFKFSWRRRW
jgi:hypothetical protein